MRDAQEVLRGPFDARTHKETFPGYFEAVVRPDGLVEYAVPSHKEKLKRIMRDAGRDPENECPREFWADYLTWLMRETGCVCLWSNGYAGKPNVRQRHAIIKLCADGLMRLRKFP